MKKKDIIAGSFLALWAISSFAQEADNVEKPVISTVVETDTFQERMFVGLIEAQVTTDLAFETPGRMIELAVSVGDMVKKGDILARLDQITLEEDVLAAKANLNAMTARADAAQKTLDRTSQLFARGVVSKEQLEMAQSGRNTAFADVDIAKAKLTSAEEAVTYGVLPAPFDGVIVKKQLDAGTVVAAGESVLTISGLDQKEAVLNIPEKYMGLIKSDTRFLVHPHTFAGQDLKGVLRLVEPVADAALRSRRIKVSLPDAPPALRLGVLVSATLETNDGAAIYLPAEAILRTGQAAKVWVVDPGSRTVRRVDVAVGPEIDGKVVVFSGLNDGDEVVIKGVHSLKDGQKVARGNP